MDDTSDNAQNKKRQDLLDPDEGYVETRSVTQQWLEFVLLCLCNIAWTIDGSILPLFFKEIQGLFGVSQTSLSMLSTVKGWSAAVFSFPCGFFAELLPRPQLIGLGMLIWSSGLMVCAAAGSFETMFVGRVLNGAGLGIVHPVLLSLVAAKSPPSRRGSAFGSLFFTGQVCSTVFGLLATRYADASVAGVPGWRVSVMVVVALSGAIGAAIMLQVTEPQAEQVSRRRKTQGFVSVFVENMPKCLELFRYPTFVLIVLSGIPGTAPWTIFPFFTEWLELSCFTHAESAWVFSAFGWGMAFSSLLSGWLLNFVASRFPDRGPPTMASLSVASGIPFLLLILYLLPKPEPSAEGQGEVPIYSLAFALFGLSAAMCGTINKKVFADVVPPAILTYLFAIDELIVNGIGNLIGLTMGVVTDKVFDYDARAAARSDCAPDEARKLGSGMFAVCCAAWVVCFLIYSGMHCSYPRDRRRQLEARRAEA